ncbi:UvrY/SirA/GacA family response regulator transcription factor [Alkalimarinus sediminis]|uniref:UvrY/SirA/GacA family response regulator transcription factor n=1 Tax=Alkalimarinus sediminis TaxID=1632866 RepID=A0A9E8KRI4_9ALTE|nr:UvrY/SirA/GacA family response regulator transcription factor [Alkalimarinus sediminis]UZW76102.1 UvrY/SirA/GacA family response regulator transcription factor [Alkalimarinus sediminis]
MIKVLVVDDHDLVRAGISRMLADETGIEVVGEACSGEDAVGIIKSVHPDIILMDLKMPGIGGLEATRKIKRLDDEIKVIVVTACNDDPYPARVMQSGASAYITKGADIDEMIRAIRVVHSGQRYMSPEIAQKLALKPFDDTEEGTVFDRLSEREMQIATMIVSCIKVQDISDKLCLSPKTVNSYRYRIFEKLGITSDVELTLLAVRHGILDTENID